MNLVPDWTSLQLSS